eukprot:GEMP01002081.1.p1 GENE.GEMP01002081.1~~GEMP01002081.1.p1  ORF type:complete len:1140 (+),score=183.24 GEMP01002081.1:244-3663(+)
MLTVPTRRLISNLEECISENGSIAEKTPRARNSFNSAMNYSGDVEQMVVPSKVYESRSTDQADLLVSDSILEDSGRQPNASFATPPDASGNHSEDCVVHVDPGVSELGASKTLVVPNKESNSASSSKPTSPRSIEKPYALTRFPINASDPFSIMLLMCSSVPIMVSVVMIRLLPIVIMGILVSWLQHVRHRGVEEIDFGFYEALSPEEEYAVIALVYVGIVTPKMLQFYAPLKHFKSIVLFCSNASPYFIGFHWRMLWCSFVCFVVDLFFAPLFSMILSVYIALYLSEGSLLNVLLNAAALEFLNELDAAILNTFVDVWYRGASVAMLIKRVRRLHPDKSKLSKSRLRRVRLEVGPPCDSAHPHSAESNNNEEDFWQRNDAGKKAVFGLLKERITHERNADRWRLLIDNERGLGLASRDIYSFAFNLQVMDLASLDESMIVSEGEKLLTMIDDTDWSHTLTNRQREIFRWYHPSAALDFPIVEVSVRLPAESLSRMAPALKKSETMRTLNIVDNISGGALVKRVTVTSHAIQSSSKSLLSYRKHYYEVGMAISSILEVNASLEVIRIDGAEMKITHHGGAKEDMEIHLHPGQLSYEAWVPLVEGLKNIVTDLTWPTQSQTADERDVMLGNILNANNALKTIDVVAIDDVAGEGTALNNSWKTLELSSCRICDTGAVVLGNMLRTNKTLEKLSLKGNHVSDVGCRALAEGIEYNSSLTELDLQDNKIGDVGAEVIGDMLQHNKVLEKLNLGGNQVTDRGCDDLALGLGVTGNSILKELHLQHNMIGDAGVKTIGNLLMSDKPPLQKLNLAHNLVTGDGCSSLAQRLARNRILKELDLEQNNIGDVGAVAMGALLKVNKALKTLGLKHTLVADDGCRAIAEGMTYNGVLTELDLGFNKIGDAGAVAIGTMLKMNRALMKLNLKHNLVSAEGCCALADGMMHNVTLTELDLECNDIRNTGAVAIGSMLKSNRALTKLNLSANQVTDSGCRALVERMTFNGILTELELGHNNIGDAGAVAVGHMLKTNRALQKIELSRNQLTDNGCRALSEGLMHNCTVTELNLQENKIGDGGAKALGTMLKTNRALTKLNLRSNFVDDAGWHALADGLEHNSMVMELDLRNNTIRDAGAVTIETRGGILYKR